MTAMTRKSASDKTRWLPNKSVVAAPYWDRHIAWAVRAVKKGEASPEQQMLAWDWISYVTGSVPEFQDLSFRMGPDAERETAFAEGKRWVGLQLNKMTSAALDGAIHKEIADEDKADKRRRKDRDSDE